MDGFQIPNGYDELVLETLLSQYAINREKITALCQQYPKEFLLWIDDEHLEQCKSEILLLMSKNYVLIRKLPRPCIQ